MTQLFKSIMKLLIFLFFILDNIYSQPSTTYSNGSYGSIPIDSLNDNQLAQQSLTLPVPELIYPENNATNVPIVPEIKIGTVADADRYEIQLSTDRYFLFNIISNSYWQFEAPLNISELLFIPGIRNIGDFKNEERYYWRARALANNKTETSPWSQVYEYKTAQAGTPVTHPELINPQSNSINTWIELMFSWTEISNSKRYQIQVSENSSFNGYRYNFPEINFQVFDLKPQFKYYGRVVAYNDNSISQFSEPVIFYTGNYAVLTKDEYTFTDGSGFDDYENNLEVYWLIKPENGKNITLTFERFETEANYDYVSIYDEESIQAPLIGTFSGNQIPPQIISSGNQLLIEFKTDWLSSRAGWQASYITEEKGWQWPVTAPRITQDFATFNSGSSNKFHNGIDMTSSLIAPTSTEVYAASSGKVLISNNTCVPGENCANGFGNYVVIEHSDNLYTLYAHLDSVNVTDSQDVEQGEKIGMMGSTGRASYPLHLHFEVLTYRPTGSNDFDNGYSENYPDLNRRRDPKNYFNNKIVRIKADNLNVRQSPIISGTKFNTLMLEQYYVSIEQYNNWHFVYLPYNTIPNTSFEYVDVDRYGWVSGDYVELVNNPQFQIVRIDGQELWKNGNKTWLSVYAESSASSMELTKVWSGQRFVAIEFDDQWCKINLPSDAGQSEGWIKLDFITNVESIDHTISDGLFLSQNYPNPFNPTTKIKYRIPLLGGDARGGLVSLKVFNTLGEEVALLVNEEKQPGNHEVKFDGSNLPSGVYFYRLQTSSFIQTKKFILLR